MDLTREDAEKELEKVFGISEFYDSQWETIKHIFEGKRVLLIQKTGFGKSLCYQYPALFFGGTTIIFSPLIALMRDQIKFLKSKEIPAECINSEQTDAENKRIIDEAKRNKYKILYIAPERQENYGWIRATYEMNISMIVIDEAHCISSWGHDFRPAYRRIINLVNLLPQNFPILATTATATEIVARDIAKHMKGEVIYIRGTLIRENFSLNVVNVCSEEDKLAFLAKEIPDLTGTGLIYTGTRDKAELFSKFLNSQDINSVFYHAGLEPNSRRKIEEGLLNNKWKCIVSTNALGMGIDKPDIRFIFHTQIPVSPTHYYQEIGRAGRDGKQTYIALLYNQKDNELPLYFIENARPLVELYDQVIELLKEEPLNEYSLRARTNSSQTKIRVIIADLVDQGILVESFESRRVTYKLRKDTIIDEVLKELRTESDFDNYKDIIEYLQQHTSTIYSLSSNVLGNAAKDNQAIVTELLKNLVNLKVVYEVTEKFSKKYEYKTNAPPLDATPFIEFREFKLKEFERMLEYIRTDQCRMDYLCTYLDDDDEVTCGKCDNCLNVSVSYELDAGWERKIDDFFFNYFPEIQLVSASQIEKPLAKRRSKLVNGVALSYYAFSKVGGIIGECKYGDRGDFPQYLVDGVLRAFRSYFDGVKFDILCYIPPTESGDLVKNFAEDISKMIGVPISHSLIRVKETEPQKKFNNYHLKRDNVKNAFEYDNPYELVDKNILVIDDVCDSRATIREIGKMMTKYGVNMVAPLFIAKTISGDIK